jgi:hypothetical protein
MTTEPYAGAKRVFWVVDNGSSHRGKRAIDRLTRAFPKAVMVHTPLHASWTNQIEIFFSIVQRKVVSPNDFTDLTQVRDRLRAFEDRYNATAQPFQWSSPPPTWTICWPNSTHPPTDKKNPPPPWLPDQPPKDFERRPLSQRHDGPQFQPVLKGIRMSRLGPGRADRTPGRRRSVPAKRTAPARTTRTCADEACAATFRRGPTRSATARSSAPAAAARHVRQ